VEEQQPAKRGLGERIEEGRQTFKPRLWAQLAVI
jgi:hypothetical protein